MTKYIVLALAVAGLLVSTTVFAAASYSKGVIRTTTIAIMEESKGTVEIDKFSDGSTTCYVANLKGNVSIDCVK